MGIVAVVLDHNVMGPPVAVGATTQCATWEADTTGDSTAAGSQNPANARRRNGKSKSK